ncbi:MAG TPA: LacI family DNA-binding transcriptional regulator [Polyangiaceae bacterium]|nr:LacI family DNA-binding transcriptional regulator [Polyangiaceae bacterium]
MVTPTKTSRGSAEPPTAESRPHSATHISSRVESPKKRVTIADLARALGMDKSSVSLALRDSPRISEATRNRVRQAATEQNYSPNWAAKQLAGTAQRAVGLIMPATFECLVHPPVARTTQALARLTAQRGLTLNLIASDQLEASDEPNLALHADGLLVWGDVPAPSVQRFSAAHDRPAIVLDPHHPSYARYAGNALKIQNREGARAIVKHLLERGARHLTFVQYVSDHLGHVERWRGTRETWAKHRSLDTLEKIAHEDLTDGDLQRIAKRGDAAIFCSNDRGAMQVWHRAQSLGLAIPGDMKLAGFDGDEYGALVGLTTAEFDSEGLARMAFDAIIELVSEDSTRVVDAGVPVVLRTGSTS